MGLFRQQAVDNKTSLFATQSRLLLPISVPAFVLLAVSLIVAIVVFIVLGSYAPRESVRGAIRTTAGGVEVYASSDGTIQSLDVVEGQVIRRGQNLAVLDTARATQQSTTTSRDVLKLLRQNLAEIKTQRDRENEAYRLQEEKAREKVTALQRRHEKLRSQQEELKLALQISQRAVTRLSNEKLAAYVSLSDKDRVEAATIDARLRCREVEILIDQVLDDIKQHQHELLEIPLQRETQLAQLNRDRRQLEVAIAEKAGRDSQVASAPLSGMISTLLVREGQTVAASQPLMTIVPDASPFYAELLIPAAAIASIRVGATVKIRYDAYPYQKFGSYDGVVKSVSQTTVLPNDQRFRLVVTEPVYIATVTLNFQSIPVNGTLQRLQAGMTLTADILRDERRIVEWLFEPLIAAVRRG